MKNEISVYTLEFTTTHTNKKLCVCCGVTLSKPHNIQKLESLFCSDDCRYDTLQSAKIVSAVCYVGDLGKQKLAEYTE